MVGPLSSSALGMLALFLGVAMLAPRLVRPLAAHRRPPAAGFGGSPGRLARENSVRNPGRTALTAAALMIGLALVTFVATLGAGLRGSDRDRGQEAGQGRLRRHGEDGGGSFASPRTRRSAPPGRRGIAGVRSDRAAVAGGERRVTGIDPETIGRFYTFNGSGPRARSTGSPTTARSSLRASPTTTR